MQGFSPRFLRTPLWRLCVVFGLVWFLGACGGDGGGTSPDGDVVDTDTDTSPPDAGDVDAEDADAPPSDVDPDTSDVEDTGPDISDPADPDVDADADVDPDADVEPDPDVVTPPLEPWERVPPTMTSSFRFLDHAFSFVNVGESLSVAGLQVADVVELFGTEGVCVRDLSPCVGRPDVLRWVERVNRTLADGRSEGMATASLLFALGHLDAQEYGADSAAELMLWGNRELQSLLARMAATQTLPHIAREQIQVDAREALVFLADAFANEDGEAWRLGLAILDEGGFRAGHAMVPIAYYRTDDRNVYMVRVYDPNFPQREQELFLDVGTNRWWYDATFEEGMPMLYEGNATNGNRLYFSPVTGRIGDLPNPFAPGAEESVQVHVIGELSAVATLGEGVRAGVRGGVLMQDGGALALPGFSACPCSAGFRRNTTIHATGNAVDVDMDGSGTVYVSGPNFAVRADVGNDDDPEGTPQSGQLAVSGDGRSATFTPTRSEGAPRGPVTLQLTLQTDEGPVEVNVEVSEDATVKLTTLSNGNIEVEVEDAAPNTTVSLQVSKFDEDGAATTSQNSFNTDRSDESTFSFAPETGVVTGPAPRDPCDSGRIDLDQTDVDCGGLECEARCGLNQGCLVDGDCTEDLICGAGNVCMSPGCADGRQNQQETDIDCGGPVCSPCAAGRQCLVRSDCGALGQCEEGVCREDFPVRTVVRGLRYPGQELRFEVTLDGVRRTFTVEQTGSPNVRNPLDVEFTLPSTVRWSDPTVLSAPEGATCRPVMTQGVYTQTLTFNCSWTSTPVQLTIRNVGIEACLAPRQEPVLWLETDDRTSIFSLSADMPEETVLELGHITDRWRFSNLSRAGEMVLVPELGGWATAGCDFNVLNTSGTHSAQTYYPHVVNVTCGCFRCDDLVFDDPTNEARCRTAMRNVGALQVTDRGTRAEGDRCVRDRDCLSRSCECGKESDYCIDGTGLCSAGAWRSARVSEEGEASLEVTIPDACDDLQVTLWGAAGGASAPTGETTVTRGGAGGYVQGVVPVSAGDVVSVWLGAGGSGGATVDASGAAGAVFGTPQRGGLGGGVEGVAPGRGGGGGGVSSLRISGGPELVIPGGGGASVGAEFAAAAGTSLVGGAPSAEGGAGRPGFGGGGAGVAGGVGGNRRWTPRAGGYSAMPAGLLALRYPSGDAPLGEEHLLPDSDIPDAVFCERALGQPAGHGTEGDGGGACVSLRCLARAPGTPVAAQAADPTEVIRTDDFGHLCTNDPDCDDGNCECGIHSGRCTGDTGHCGMPPGVFTSPTPDGETPSGQFVVPPLCTLVHVTAWGAGGGGATTEFFGEDEPMGGAGGLVYGYIEVEEGDAFDVWIGAGGAYGAVSGMTPAMGSLYGEPAVGGLGEGNGFGQGGGGGGGLTSVRAVAPLLLEFLVPAGAGGAQEGFAAGPGGLEPAGGAPTPDGGDAAEFTGGGGGGAGFPGGLGTDMRSVDAEGGAFGLYPEGFVTETASDFFTEAPPRSDNRDYALCTTDFNRLPAAGNFFEDGGDGCVVFRCVPGEGPGGPGDDNGGGGPGDPGDPGGPGDPTGDPLGSECSVDTDCLSRNCECGDFSGSCGGSGRCGAAVATFRDATSDGIEPTDSFTIPDQCDRIHISAWGAGGGASMSSDMFSSDPGAAGGWVSGFVDVEEGDVVDVWVGAGGLHFDHEPANGAAGSLCGTPVFGGRPDTESFPGGAGGGGGGLTSVCISGSIELAFAVPAGAGASVDGGEPGAAGGDGAGDNTEDAGGDAAPGTLGGGGGAGEPGGRGADSPGGSARGGAFGLVPDGFSSEGADPWDYTTPAQAWSANMSACTGGSSIAGSSQMSSPGARGCVIVRCVAP